MAVLETQASASLFQILKLLAQLRWDALHRVFLEDAGVEPEASCLLLDVFDYSHMASELDRAQRSGEHEEVEHPSVSVVRGVFRVLTKTLATTLPFGVVRSVDGYGGGCWQLLDVGKHIRSHPYMHEWVSFLYPQTCRPQFGGNARAQEHFCKLPCGRGCNDYGRVRPHCVLYKPAQRLVQQSSAFRTGRGGWGK